MMKKLSLKSNAFDKGEVLTRSQLKKVMGGVGSGLSGCNANCTCPSGYRSKVNHSSTVVLAVIDCSGTCSATDEVGVTCGNSGMTCKQATDSGCELIPIAV